MALSATPNHYEQATAPASTYDAMRDVWWWNNGTHPTVPNSIAYLCVDCWDGTTREQPTDGLLSNLSGGNLWLPSASPSGSLPQGAWATFRNPGGSVVAQFQIFVKMEASSQASNSLISLDDWVVGGGTGASPTIPATTLTQPPIGNGDGRFASQTTFIWSVILDEGMFYMRMMDPTGFNTNDRWTYMGEVNSWNDEVDDPRPFLTARSTLQSNFATGFNHVRISPIDSSTVVNVNNEVFFKDTMDIPTDYNDLGVDYICSINAATNTTGHRFIMGQFRNVGAIAEGLPTSRATCGITASDYRFEVWSRNSSEPSIVSVWPPGTALATGHTVITEESIPPELEPPPSSVGDTTRPEVTYIDPIAGSQIVSTAIITIDVTDDTGGFANIQLRVTYEAADPLIPTETIHGGDEVGVFEALYTSSTIAVISNGFRFVLTRDGGWPSTPTFVASPIDGSGNTT